MQGITQDELRLMLATGLLRAVGRTRDGRVTEYELTHAGRIFMSRGELAASAPEAVAQ